MLDTLFPRVPGDMCNAETWPFPVLFKVVKGANAARVAARDRGMLDDFIAGGRELVAQGADGITTNCGFLTHYQAALTEALGVPVAASSLFQVPLIDALLPPGKRSGVITFNGPNLKPDLLVAAGAAADTPVAGTEGGTEFCAAIHANRLQMDIAAAEADVLAAGDDLVARHPEVGAVVLECTNLTPYAAALSERLRLPVFSIYTFLTWFQAGLSPRAFGHPSSQALPFRERGPGGIEQETR
jgi:phosphohistidine swiveling domain-containing protein